MEEEKIDASSSVSEELLEEYVYEWRPLASPFDSEGVCGVDGRARLGKVNDARDDCGGFGLGGTEMGAGGITKAVSESAIEVCGEL